MTVLKKTERQSRCLTIKEQTKTKQNKKDTTETISRVIYR